MPILNAQQLSYKLDTGERLFSNLSFSIEQKFTAIIGRNGAGKSVLASILAGETQADSGSVFRSFNHLGYFKQQGIDSHSGQSIAEFLGVAPQINALKKVESGQYQAAELDIIGDNWQVRENLARQLAEIAITLPPETPCAQLSGGEKAKLQLLKLFSTNAELLILDEPSNHLDNKGRQWLLKQINTSKSKVLLISHDRALLHHVGAIYELTSLGLTLYPGNFSHYKTSKQTHLIAVNRKLAQAQSKQKQIARHTQLNHEKAQQRAASGKRLRKSGSQAKILLNTMRDNAEKSSSSRAIQRDNQQINNTELIRQLSQRKESLKPQAMYIQTGVKVKTQKPETLLSIQDIRIPYVDTPLIRLHLSHGDKLHLKGNNACGKSTLMKVILGELPADSGDIQRAAPLFYLDQDFRLINQALSLLGNLKIYCPSIADTQAHTLLAGMGFRGQSVHRKASWLSGGEKMKLAILIATHQIPLPLLLLDEPDNHLDIESKHLLSEALNQYRGSFILISHDREFVTDAGITETVEILSK
ncbi:ATPase component of ABC transporters with duplicated ATPase domain [Shewanella psychrophila]|uniref:ATPase component of ABC transporters with duplicated ATPase domain n=1 Tax=Shewanella psychrophila TaxID=225848 RepID=A0A1S6HJF2_9GAMM|nr:ATP-binding cassette domain-containing protein [Shewanella psychrophila]AQS35643.1 ATPase component of ABC transporters with duplicated ATPase domain [Shewanella psychrophila]